MENRQVIGSAQKQRKKASKYDADASRARILEAAKKHFSRISYEGVGVREIASDADVDPALVIRYFGSKEGLFREIAMQAFGTHEFLEGGTAALPDKVADTFTGEIEDWVRDWGYDPLRLLLCSIGSPTAGPILAEYLDKDFIQPLTAALGSADARERGVMLAAQIVGLALVRIAVAMRHDGELRPDVLRTIVTTTIRSIIAEEDALVQTAPLPLCKVPNDL